MRGETRGSGPRPAGHVAGWSPWHLTGKPRSPDYTNALLWAGCGGAPSRRHLMTQGEGPWRTNQAGQTQAPGTDRPERIRRGKSRTARTRKVAPQAPAGRRPGQCAAGQTPSGSRQPALRVGPGKTGLERGRCQAGPEPRGLPGTLPGRAAAQGRHGLGGRRRPWARPTTPGEPPGGGPAGRSWASRECTGRAGRASGLSAPWGPVDPPGEQVPGLERQPSDS